MAVIGRRWTRYLPGRRRARRAAAPEFAPANFTVADEGPVLVVAGEIDIATAPVLRAGLAARPVGEPLVLDLSGVSFMDSTGLAILLGAAAERGAALAIVCPEGPARLLLAVTGTEDELPLHASREDALRAVNPGGRHV